MRCEMREGTLAKLDFFLASFLLQVGQEVVDLSALLHVLFVAIIACFLPIFFIFSLDGVPLFERLMMRCGRTCTYALGAAS